MAQRDDSADFSSFRQTGSTRALARVFDRLAPELLLVAAHVAPRGVEPEDLVQATFLAAIEHAGRWDASRPLLPWLIGILVQCARNERRRAARSVDPRRVMRQQPADPAEQAEAKELAERLERAVAALPDPYRHLLVLRLAHGLSAVEIAHALGRPLNTVKTQLARGRDILRQALPAGLSGAALVALASGRALAQVRKHVLARGRSLVPAATAAGVISGALVMKKTVACLAVLVLGVATWWAWPSYSPEPPARESLAIAASPEVPAAGALPDAVASRDASDAPSSSPVRAASVGSILVYVVWSDGTPAQGVSVALPSPEGSATSDALGEIRWPEVPAGKHILFSSAGPSPCQVRAGELTEHRIVLASSLVIEGRVVDSQGRPASGAEVVRWDWSETSLLCRLATSDAEGRFACRTDRGGMVFARKDGHRPSPWHHVELKHRNVTLELPLGGPGLELRGSVVDRQGKGIEAALLLVTTLDRQAPRDLPAIAMRTDAQGEFRTRDLGPGSWCVAVKAKGFAPAHHRLEVARDAAPVLVRLSEGARIQGIVRTTTGVASDAVVACSWIWVNEHFDASRSLYASALRQHAQLLSYHLELHTATDAAGRYVLEHAPPGPIRLQAAASGVHRATREADLRPGDEVQWDPLLDAGLAIAGRVVGPDGQAAAGWQVTAGRTEGGGRFHRARTDEDGRFVLTGLTDGDYDLRVTLAAKGQAMRDAPELHWTKERARAGARDVVLRLAHGLEDAASIKGRILDAGGAAVMHEVDVYSVAWKEQSHAAQAPASGFEIGPLPPGLYRVHARVHGWGCLSLGEHRLAPGQKCDLGSIRLGALGSVRVELRMPTGEPVESFDLRLRDAFDNEQGARGQAGAAATSPLPPGLYDLDVWGERFAPLRQRVQVEAGRQVPVTLVVDPGLVVRFELAAEKALVGGWVYATFTDRDRAVSVVRLNVQEQETIVFQRGFRPGRYAYQILVAGRWQATGSVEVVGASHPATVAVPLVRIE